MYAIRLHEFGPAENLSYEQVPDPHPGDGQLRIAVEASGVHFIDTALRAGARGAVPMPLPELPAIPGREVAGVVESVGNGVDAGWIGRRVVAHLGPVSGGYARRAVVAASAVHPLPDGVGADAAVAMIGTGRTAVVVLDVAAPAADDVVLVTAAAGGLGTLFVQAARRAGAVVVGVAGGADKVEQVRKAGATHAIDYREGDWPQRVADALGDRAVSLVLDGVGGRLGRSAFDLLGDGGRFVMFGWASGELTPFTSADLVERALTARWALNGRMMGRPGVLREFETRSLAELAAGRLTPLVQRFPLEKAADAHAAMEARRTVGKVVLV